MKRKFTTKIINFILNLYGKLFKFDCPFIYNQDEFEYVSIPFTEDCIVYYIGWSFLYSDMHDELFNKYLRFLGLEYYFPTFIMSLLHEVGHHKTLGNINNYSKMIDITKYKKLFNINSRKELDLLIYYNVPDEYEASKWAIQFANEHVLSLKVLTYILYPLINHCYKHHWSLMIQESKIYTEK